MDEQISESVTLQSPQHQEGQPNPKRHKMSSTSDEEDNFDITAAAAEEGGIPRKTRYKRRKVAIFFAYCGVGYQGMQKNPGAKTIEGDLEEALYHSGAVPEVDRGQHKRFDFARSARTDKGVSAVGQVVSGRFYVDPPGFVDRLNAHLSAQIRVFGYKRATASFNAKKFCDKRRYAYLIPSFAFDPSCHRDRESVIASLGFENELVKCIECSERGRKVFGVMGKQNFGGKVVTEAVAVDSGILSNEGYALSEEKMEARSDISSYETEEKTCNEVTSNEGIGEGGENAQSLSAAENKSEFRYGEVERERLNRILKYYEGTHNFHNFTSRIKPEDPAAKRYIISFTANTTLSIDGIEFVKFEILGQSFMLHQIRKMIGLAVAVMRNLTPESLIKTALEQKANVNVPLAPEVGLYLDECFFSSYNNKWKASHEELSLEAYAEEAENFKMKFIYPHIASTERKDGAVALWLHSLNHRNFPDLDAPDCLPTSDATNPTDLKNGESIDANHVEVHSAAT